MKEIHAFDVRMGEKMMQGVDMSAYLEARKNAATPPMGALFAGKPGASEAMKQMNAEREKLQGTHVLEVTTMGAGGTGTGTPMATGTAGAAPPPPAPAGSTVAGQIATDTASQTAASESSKLGVFGSALTNSALNVFRRTKSVAPPTPVAAATPVTGTTAAGGNQAASAALMTMTVQKTNFSADPVPPSVFEVPAGFTKVESNIAAGPK